MTRQHETAALATHELAPGAPASGLDGGPSIVDYRIFGGTLRSDVSFPALPVGGYGEPTWTLRTTGPEALEEGARFYSMEGAGPRPVRLYRTSRGFRLHYLDATGSFDIVSKGREILWRPDGEPSMDYVRVAVLGRVFALAMHESGTVCLHGSAVETRDGVVVFCAPKLHGKSSLALALTRGGGRLVTDDTVAVDLGHEAVVRPGVHHVRLWDDSASELRTDDLGGVMSPSGKQVLQGIPDELLMTRPTRCAAIYVLRPVIVREGAPVAERVPLPPTQAAIALTPHTKIGSMLVGEDSAAVFAGVASIASTVPVYRLDLMRDFERLGSAVQQILGWHGGGVRAI